MLCHMVSHGHNQTCLAVGQRALGRDCSLPGTPMASTVSAPWEMWNYIEEIPGADPLAGQHHMHCRKLAYICPEKSWMPHPWKCLRPGWMWLWATHRGALALQFLGATAGMWPQPSCCFALASPWEAETKQVLKENSKHSGSVEWVKSSKYDTIWASPGCYALSDGHTVTCLVKQGEKGHRMGSTDCQIY